MTITRPGPFLSCDFRSEIARLRTPPRLHEEATDQMRQAMTAEAHLDAAATAQLSAAERSTSGFERLFPTASSIAQSLKRAILAPKLQGIGQGNPVKLMGKPANHGLDPDTGAIRALAELLAETGLSEIEYAVGDHRIRVARETKAALPVNGHATDAASPPVPSPTNGGSALSPGADGRATAGTLSSPMVGVAYLAPEPGAEPFVRVGDVVAKDQPLLIIEAMKVMNQIRAPQAGRIARIFIADATPVEYGAPLMLIE
jgi:acetyl-CoA carboxylase biotin carboxyl carrier protein